MSTKRKKNSRSPLSVEVTFILIHEKAENPWPSEYYMCGHCGHAVKYVELSYHAKTNHRAKTIKILEIDDTEVFEEDVAKQIEA